MDKKTLVAMGIGWTCAALALLLVKAFHIEGIDALVIILLGGGAPTLIALNV